KPREIIVLDNFVRGRRDNLSSAISSAPLKIIDGDIRDRAVLAKFFEGVDIVFHQAAIRITQCAEEPLLAFEVLAEGTFNVL
ncbi:NAD-dependent epimerase/dehydratase family protein, partial [Rhizobium ruizarguesonis]